MHEVRVAIRRLNQRRGATIASILTLATAIGAAAATWSLVSAVVIRPLPVADPERLVAVDVTYPGMRFPLTGQVYPNYQRLHQSGIFEAAAAAGRWPLSIAANGSSSTGQVYFVSDSFFQVLGTGHDAPDVPSERLTIDGIRAAI